MRESEPGRACVVLYLSLSASFSLPRNGRRDAGSQPFRAGRELFQNVQLAPRWQFLARQKTCYSYHETRLSISYISVLEKQLRLFLLEAKRETWPLNAAVRLGDVHRQKIITHSANEFHAPHQWEFQLQRCRLRSNVVGFAAAWCRHPRRNLIANPGMYR